MKKTIILGSVAALALVLGFSIQAFAATYHYVNTSGQLASIEASNGSDALQRAVNRASNSGVMLASGFNAPVQSTVVSGNLISAEQARVIATGFYKGNGVFADAEIESINGVSVYAVEFRESDGNEVDVKISAESGALVVIEDDRGESESEDADGADDDEDDEDEKVTGTAKISEPKAKEIANNAYKGTGTLTDTELEMEKGVLVYAVEFTESDGNEVDVKIDAKTGKVVLIESDSDEGDMDDDEGDNDD